MRIVKEVKKEMDLRGVGVGDVLEIKSEYMEEPALWFVVMEKFTEEDNYILRRFEGGNWQGLSGYHKSIVGLIKSIRGDVLAIYPRQDYEIVLKKRDEE